MIGVITGDIIHSRRVPDSQAWMVPLKKLFGEFGPSPRVWDIYRGDSFQLEVDRPAEALYTALRIKATVKSIRKLDVRMAIGIGEKHVATGNVTETGGQAFIHSGEKLEGLKKAKRTLAIRSPWPEVDREVNLYLRLALIAMDHWSEATAEMVKYTLANPGLAQKELGAVIGISQSSVSERQKRAFLSEIMAMESRYREIMARHTGT